jgi:hypothetical protein
VQVYENEAGATLVSLYHDGAWTMTIARGEQNATRFGRPAADGARRRAGRMSIRAGVQAARYDANAGTWRS